MTRRHLIPRPALAGPLMAGALALAIAACSSAETRWQHPTIPSDQWSIDAAQCRHEARRAAEKEVLQGSTYGGNGDMDETDRAFLQADLEKRSRQLFEHCMRALGYRPADH